MVSAIIATLDGPVRGPARPAAGAVHRSDIDDGAGFLRHHDAGRRPANLERTAQVYIHDPLPRLHVTLQRVFHLIHKAGRVHGDIQSAKGLGGGFRRYFALGLIRDIAFEGGAIAQCGGLGGQALCVHICDGHTGAEIAQNSGCRGTLCRSHRLSRGLFSPPVKMLLPSSDPPRCAVPFRGLEHRG